MHVNAIRYLYRQLLKIPRFSKLEKFFLKPLRGVYSPTYKRHSTTMRFMI